MLGPAFLMRYTDAGVRTSWAAHPLVCVQGLLSESHDELPLTPYLSLLTYLTGQNKNLLTTGKIVQKHCTRSSIKNRLLALSLFRYRCVRNSVCLQPFVYDDRSLRILECSLCFVSCTMRPIIISPRPFDQARLKSVDFLA